MKACGSLLESSEASTEQSHSTGQFNPEDSLHGILESVCSLQQLMHLMPYSMYAEV